LNQQRGEKSLPYLWSVAFTTGILDEQDDELKLILTAKDEFSEGPG